MPPKPNTESNKSKKESQSKSTSNNKTKSSTDGTKKTPIYKTDDMDGWLWHSK
jgi:hypothetical protein